jgi:hypothetical protein
VYRSRFAANTTAVTSIVELVDNDAAPRRPTLRRRLAAVTAAGLAAWSVGRLVVPCASKRWCPLPRLSTVTAVTPPSLCNTPLLLRQLLQSVLPHRDIKSHKLDVDSHHTTGGASHLRTCDGLAFVLRAAQSSCNAPWNALALALAATDGGQCDSSCCTIIDSSAFRSTGP